MYLQSGKSVKYMYVDGRGYEPNTYKLYTFYDVCCTINFHRFLKLLEVRVFASSLKEYAHLLTIVDIFRNFPSPYYDVSLKTYCVQNCHLFTNKDSRRLKWEALKQSNSTLHRISILDTPDGMMRDLSCCDHFFPKTILLSNIVTRSLITNHDSRKIRWGTYPSADFPT